MMLRTTLICIAALSLAVGVRADDYSSKAAQNWPQWRGPDANGAAPASKAPDKWSESEHVLWKVDDPGRGNSTPIIWEDKLFLLTAVPTGKKVELTPKPEPKPGEAAPRGHPQVSYNPEIQNFTVLCLDAKTGKEIWRKVAREELPIEGHHQKGSYASASPVTDGERVYAYFGSYGLYCYDLAGKELWKKDFGKMKTRLAFGEGSSPVLDGDRLIINFDNEGNSFIAALDGKTGNEVWKKPREESTAWSTPIIVQHGGKKQIVVSATRRVRGYDAATGDEIWECGGQTLNAIPTSVSSGGLVFATSGFQGKVLKAIKLGMQGDLTEKPDAIAWEIKKATPYVPSPLLVGDELLLVDDKGFVSNYEPKTGEAHYAQQRVPGNLNFTSSPVAADGKVYLPSEQGDTLVFKTGKTFEVVATNKLDDVFYASPAVAGGNLYLRGVKHFYCIK